MSCPTFRHNILREQAWKFGKDVPCEHCGEFVASKDQKPIRESELPPLRWAQLNEMHLVVLDAGDGHHLAMGAGWTQREAFEMACGFLARLASKLGDLQPK